KGRGRESVCVYVCVCVYFQICNTLFSPSFQIYMCGYVCVSVRVTCCVCECVCVYFHICNTLFSPSFQIYMCGYVCVSVRVTCGVCECVYVLSRMSVFWKFMLFYYVSLLFLLFSLHSDFRRNK